mmetsp:Transcript_17939/g.35055  ORF Transcript_17939/g.35055 Transcript_17939/m.35055 type:complete len:244 (+) Transcript_17939:164-895(+)
MNSNITATYVLELGRVGAFGRFRALDNSAQNSHVTDSELGVVQPARPSIWTIFLCRGPSVPLGGLDHCSNGTHGLDNHLVRSSRRPGIVLVVGCAVEVHSHSAIFRKLSFDVKLPPWQRSLRGTAPTIAICIIGFSISSKRMDGSLHLAVAICLDNVHLHAAWFVRVFLDITIAVFATIWLVRGSCVEISVHSGADLGRIHVKFHVTSEKIPGCFRADSGAAPHKPATILKRRRIRGLRGLGV